MTNKLKRKKAFKLLKETIIFLNKKYDKTLFILKESSDYVEILQVRHFNQTHSENEIIQFSEYKIMSYVTLLGLHSYCKQYEESQKICLHIF
jgi:hypothetical protein